MPEGHQDPCKEDIYAGERRISRPDSDLPDWYLPDASYRPIPIAWFAGALVMQIIAMPFIFIVTVGYGLLLVIGTSALISMAIGLLSWRRGIGIASPAWQIGTVAMLLVFFAINCLAALA